LTASACRRGYKMRRRPLIPSSLLNFPSCRNPNRTRPPIITAIRGIPRPCRGHRRHPRAQHAHRAIGIELEPPGAPPLTSSSPTTGAVDSGDSDHPLPRRCFHYAHGKLLIPPHLLALSLDLWFALAPGTCIRHRDTSSPAELRRPNNGGATLKRFPAMP
jgi:hypothetical protein